MGERWKRLSDAHNAAQKAAAAQGLTDRAEFRVPYFPKAPRHG